MEEGSRKVDTVKVFLCGDPAAGKTTLKQTLTKADEDSESYKRTAGIDVAVESVKGAGKYLFWDCAGQAEYSVTHGMFLGVGQGIFIVMFDLQGLAKGERPVITYWLPFIKAARDPDDESTKPRVVLVGTHMDKIHDRRAGERAAQSLLQHARELFDGFLTIDDTLILMDTRDESCDGMETLRAVFKTHREGIIGQEMIPKLCDDIQQMITPMRETPVPIIGWGEFRKRTEERYPGIDDKSLRSVTEYLHIMGEVYLAECPKKEHQLILNTQWFMAEIIGPAFAGDEFLDQMKTLPDQPFYTLEQLCEFFPTGMDVPQLLALLDHMDLVHETSDKRFLLPGKLPLDIPEIELDAEEAYDMRGMAIECSRDIDIFNPSAFPCIQKKILDTHGNSVKVSRSAVEFVMSSIRVIVQLTKHKRSINIAVTVPSKESTGSSYQSLQYALALIQEEISFKSPGTDIEVKYISPRSLKTSKTLEHVVTYSKKSLVEAERQDGVVVRDGRPEQVSQITFQGYDATFLEVLGSKCPYEWLPVANAERCFRPLDRLHDRMEDFRSVGSVLGIGNDEVNEIADLSKRREESPTCNIIKTWCKKTKEKMTIGMLYSVLTQLSLVAKEDSAKSIEEVLKLHACKSKHTKGSSHIDLGISKHLIQWRLVLRRLWDLMETDMDPNMLTSRLHYLPPKDCLILEGTPASDVQQRIKNVNTLLLFLLQRERPDWPRDLIDGLRETGQQPLAQELEEEYHKIVQKAQGIESNESNISSRTQEQGLGSATCSRTDLTKNQTKMNFSRKGKVTVTE